MAVYVDPILMYTPENGQTKRRGYRWCHMIADTPEELREMAEKIGASKRYLHHAETEKEHFDLTPPRRASAVYHGAIEISQKDLVQRIMEKRNAAIGFGQVSEDADSPLSPV